MTNKKNNIEESPINTNDDVEVYSEVHSMWRRGIVLDPEYDVPNVSTGGLPLKGCIKYIKVMLVDGFVFIAHPSIVRQYTNNVN